MKETEVPNKKVWRNNALFFLSSQAISVFGSSLVDYAIVWHITLQTKSAMLMSLSMIFVFVPKILISLISGIWADRYDKKKLVIFADLFIAASTLLFAILFYNGYTQLWIIYLVLILRSIGTGVQIPASKSIIPLLVPEKGLLRINGFANSIDSIINVLSPAVGGLLLLHYELHIVAFIDVLTALIGVFIFNLIRIHHIKKVDESGNISYLVEFKEGFKYLKNNTILKRLLLNCIILIILIVPLILLVPLNITRIFGDEVWRLSLYETIYGIGCILGGLLIALLFKVKQDFKIICLSFIVIGISSCILTINHFYIVISAGFIIGLFITISNSVVMSIIQKHSDSNYIGRVMGLVQVFSNSFYLIGLVIFGIIGDIIAIDYIFRVMGVGLVIYSIIYLIFLYPKEKGYKDSKKE